MSIWSDIQDRSCGEKQREEDKNQLRYLSEKYKDFIDLICLLVKSISII